MSIITLLIDEYESRVKKNYTAKNDELTHIDKTRLDFDQDSVITDNTAGPVSVDNCCASTGKRLVSF